MSQVNSRTCRLGRALDGASLGLFVLAMGFTALTGTGLKMVFQWPGIIGIATAAFFVSILSRERVEGKRLEFVCQWSMIGFALYMIARARYTEVIYFGREDMTIVASALMTYLVTANLVTSPYRRLAVVLGIIFATVIHCGFAVYQKFENPDYVLLSFLTNGEYLRTGTYEGRLSGGFNAPSHFGSFTIMVIGLVTGLLLWTRRCSLIVALLTFLATLSVVAVLTISRAAMVGGVAVLAATAVILLFSWRRFWGKQFRLVALGVVGVGCIGAAGLWQLAGRDYLARTAANSKTGSFLGNSMRPAGWESAVQQWRASPMIGNGSRAYQYLCRENLPARMPGWLKGELMFAHSDVLQLLSDYGIVGAGLLLVTTVLHFANGVRWLKARVDAARDGGLYRGGISLGISCGAMLALVGGFVHASMDYNFHIPVMAHLGAFCFGVLSRPGAFFEGREMDRSDWNRGNPGAARRFFPRIGVCAISLPLVFFGIRYFEAELLLERATTMEDTGPFLPIRAALLREAEVIDPMNPEIPVSKGRNSLALAAEMDSKEEVIRRIGAAELDFKRALFLYPRNIFVMEALAETVEILGRSEEASEILEEAIRLAPHYGYVYTWYGKHLEQLGDFEGAIEQYERSGVTRVFRDWGASLKVQRLRKLLRDRGAVRPEG